jgi:hypothetical protein
MLEVPELDDVDEPRPPDSAIVDGALALHGAILVVASLVALLVGGIDNGVGLVVALPLQLGELLGVNARMGCDLVGVLVVCALMVWGKLSNLFFLQQAKPFIRPFNTFIED